MSMVAFSAAAVQPAGWFSGEYEGANITWPGVVRAGRKSS